MVYKRLERFLIHLDRVDSTNAYANNLLKTTQVLNGNIVLADYQIAGRGQRSTTWTSQPGKNLNCSIILRPEVDARHSFYLNIIASLSVRKALSDMGLGVVVKWPNDILIDHKKVCRILIENQMVGQKIASSIIGIGLNVNQSDMNEFDRAISLKIALGREFEIMEILDQVYGYLDFYYNLLLESNFDLLLKHYYEHLYLLNKTAEYQDAAGKFEGIITGIDNTGRLIIQKDSGSKSYDIKEITFCY